MSLSIPPLRACARLLLGLVMLLGGMVAVTVAAPARAAAVPDCASAGYQVTTLGGPNFYIDAGTTPDFRSAYTGYRVVNNSGTAVSDLYVRLGDFTGGSIALAAQQPASLRLGDLASGAGQSLFWYLTAVGASTTAQGHSITVYRHDPALPTAVAVCTTAGSFAKVLTSISASTNSISSLSATGGTPKLGSTFTITVTGDTGKIGQGADGDAYSFWMSPAVAEGWPAGAFRLISTSVTMSKDGTAAAQTWTDTLRLASLGGTDRPYSASYTFRAVGFTSGATEVKPVQQITSGTQIKYTGTYPSGALPAITPPSNDLTVAASASPATLDSAGGEVTYDVALTGTAGAEIDGFDVELPGGATPVSGGVIWGNQPAADPVAVGGRWHVSGPFTVPVGGGHLRVRITHDTTPGARTSRILGTLGSSYLGTTASALNGSNAATATVNVNQSPIAHDAIASVDGDGDLLVEAAELAADPDLDPLSLTSATAQQGVAGVIQGQLHYHGTPSEEGDPVAFTVADGRGGTASATLTVYPAGIVQTKQSQSLEVDAPSSVFVDRTATVDATASSGLEPRYSSSTIEVCTVDADGVVTGHTVGTCTIAVNQPGDATWKPAPTVTRQLSVDKRSQVLTAADPQPTTVDVDAHVTVGASSDQGLAVAWSVTTTETCEVDDDGLVTGLAVGECVVRASQPGDNAIEPADPIEIHLSVQAAPIVPQAPGPAPAPAPAPAPSPAPAPAKQSLDLQLPDRVLAGAGTVAVRASSSAGLPVTLALVGGPCRLAGTALTVPAIGTCVVEASQAGADGIAAADPVRAQVEVVLPADDVLVVPGDGTRSARLDLLANDPAGLTLRGVGTAAHGATTGDATGATYRASQGYRGADSFQYTVTDGLGRTATATASVEVRNAKPTVQGGSLTQVAGTTRTAQIDAVDTNADELTISATTTTRDVQVEVRGRSLVITPGPRVSGVVRVEVAVDDGAGGTATASYVDTVSPAPVASARRVITAEGTRLSWTAAPTADASYAVVANGRVVCRTAATTCSVRRVLGPVIDVVVRVLGADRTTSTDRTAAPEGDRQVLMATVYFQPGADTLTARQRAALQRVADRILEMGFRTADLQGYTDSDGGVAYNLQLSRRRTRTVAQLLDGRAIGSTQAWFGMNDPVSTDQSAAGKAANRRVEIYVGF